MFSEIPLFSVRLIDLILLSRAVSAQREPLVPGLSGLALTRRSSPVCIRLVFYGFDHIVKKRNGRVVKRDNNAELRGAVEDDFLCFSRAPMVALCSVNHSGYSGSN